MNLTLSLQLLLTMNSWSLERNEAHKFYCGTSIRDFRKIEITTCTQKEIAEIDQKDELTENINNILTEVKKTSLNEFCISQAFSEKAQISGIDPLPKNECVCDMRTAKAQKKICNEDLDLAQLKEQLAKVQIDNFDEINKNSIITIEAIEESDCDLDRFSYCSEKFKNKKIITQKNKSTELPYKDDETINKDRDLAFKRLEEISNGSDNFKDFILRLSNGNPSVSNIILENLCSADSNFPQEVKQLQYDIMLTHSSIDFTCNSTDEISTKSNLFNTIASKIFDGGDVDEKISVREIKRAQCQKIERNLEAACSPEKSFEEILEHFNKLPMKASLSDDDLVEKTTYLNCLYNGDNIVLRNDSGTMSSLISVRKDQTIEIEAISEIVDEMKEVADNDNLTQEDRTRLKKMEEKIEKDYGIKFDIFKDNKNSIIAQIKTSIYKKEIAHRQSEISKLQEELRSNKNMTFADKERANKKIKKLSQPISKEDFFDRTKSTSYQPNYSSSVSSIAEEKFQFPTYDINSNGEFVTNGDGAISNNQNEADSNSSSVANTKTSSSNNQRSIGSTGSSSTSGGINTSASVTSSPLVSIMNYDSIKNYNVPTRKQENQALYDGLDPEVKAIFLQDEKIMRLYRFNNDKYELEEEFDARKFYANVNQFDPKTKELATIFFKRYALEDLNAILKR